MFKQIHINYTYHINILTNIWVIKQNIKKRNVILNIHSTFNVKGLETFKGNEQLHKENIF